MLLSWVGTAVMFMLMNSVTGFFMNGFLDKSLWQNDSRLPTAIYPFRYRLKLIPYISNADFSGSVEISVTCEEPTNAIVLHAHKDLDIKFVTVMAVRESPSAQMKDIVRNETTDQLKIILEEKMDVGDSYQLLIQFSGKMKTDSVRMDTMCGFFRGNYTENGTVSSYAGTQMCIKCARRLFPCFDEPRFKSEFEISVAHPKNLTVLSVMPVESSKDAEEEDWIWDHFAQTSPISTFSVNIFMSSLLPENPVPVTTKYGTYTFQYHLGTDAQYKPLRSRLEQIPQILEFLEDFLGVPFPLSKLDIVVIPHHSYYYQKSSMGTLVYSEEMIGLGHLLIIPDLIDQWVVHAVTPEWWDEFNITNILGMYLAKASFVNVTNKESWYGVETHEFYTMLSEPSLLQYDGGSLGSFFDMFKGDWFLQMLTSTLSENTIRRGIKAFLGENMFDTYYEAMLWSTLEDEALDDGTLDEDTSLETLVKSWLHKQAYPVLTVKRNYEENSASLEQHAFVRQFTIFREGHRYERIPDNWTEKAKEMLWWVPVSYLSPCNMKPNTIRPSAWLKEERQLSIFNLPDSDHFVIANPTDSGMFLVNYDQENWNLIMQSLISSKHKLSTLTRKKVLQDATILAVNGYLKFSTFLNMTLFLINETEPSVWTSFVSTLSRDLEGDFWWTPVEDKLSMYVRRLLTPLYESIKRSEIDFSEIDSYNNLESYDFEAEIIRYDVQRVLEKVGFQPFINESHINPRRRKALSVYPVEYKEEKLIIFCPEFLKNISSDSNWLEYVSQLDTYTQNLAYNYDHFWKKSLAWCPHYADFINIILNGILNENNTNVTENKWYSITKILTDNPTAHNITFHFFLQNLDALRGRFPPGHDTWRQFLTSVVKKVRSEEQLKMVKSF